MNSLSLSCDLTTHTNLRITDLSFPMDELLFSPSSCLQSCLPLFAFFLFAFLIFFSFFFFRSAHSCFSYSSDEYNYIHKWCNADVWSVWIHLAGLNDNYLLLLSQTLIIKWIVILLEYYTAWFCSCSDENDFIQIWLWK